jgi:hypothetical protein
MECGWVDGRLIGRVAFRNIVSAVLGLLAALTVPELAAAGNSSRLSVVPRTSSGHPRLARGKFLMANRSLVDPTFAEAVVLLVDYDDNGALGVVVNRPTEVPLVAALPEVKELRQRADRIYRAGVARPHGLAGVTHAQPRSPWKSSSTSPRRAA